MPIFQIDNPVTEQRFCQQELHHCFPKLHPGYLVPAFGILATFFIVIGAIFIQHSNQMLFEELPMQIDKTGSGTVSLQKMNMSQPVYVYYKLPNFYQNVRSFVQGVNYTQMSTITALPLMATCFDAANKLIEATKTNVPCSVVYRSAPEYVVTVTQNALPLTINEAEIAWQFDRDYDAFFGPGFKAVPNWQRKAVWIRQSPFPDAVKPVGKLLLTSQESLTVTSLFKFSDQLIERPVNQSLEYSLIFAQLNLVGAAKENQALAAVCLAVGCFLVVMVLVLSGCWVAQGPMSAKYYEPVR